MIFWNVRSIHGSWGGRVGGGVVGVNGGGPVEGKKGSGM